MWNIPYKVKLYLILLLIIIIIIINNIISNDGKYGISPNLAKIKYTQLGYGIHTTNAMANTNAPSDDGFYLTDINTGKCRMIVSLALLSSLIPSFESCKAIDTPTYGNLNSNIIITNIIITTIILYRFSCKMVNRWKTNHACHKNLRKTKECW